MVGAAIVRGGRVLAARRTSPPELAGRWELPGGKVEPGETPEEALERELAEELGVEVRVGDWLTPRVPVGETLELRVAFARLVDGEAEPAAREHDQVRWLRADELAEVPWAQADRPFLPQVAAELRVVRHRAVFFDEDDARTAAERLTREGWQADLERERYQGEDDDEDHPWAVVTDAPELLVELVVDELEGWLDTGDLPVSDLPLPDLPTPVAPLDLPDAPRRVKRPDLQ